MPSHDEFFDRIRETMDRPYNADPRTPNDLAALKTIRDHVVRAVAAIESVTPESMYRDLEEIRSDDEDEA